MYEIRIDHQLRQLNAYLNQYGKERMKSLGITSAQNMLLIYFLTAQKEEYYPSEICEALGLTKATVSAMLKALQKSGYLKMYTDDRDERRKKVVLTNKTFEKQDEIKAYLKIRGACMFKGISAPELAGLEHTLDKMIQNLKAAQDGDQSNEEAMI